MGANTTSPASQPDFGASINALRIAGHYLASSDSQAWSAVARREHIRLDGCQHSGDCRNCLSWAVAYRQRVLVALDANGRIREHGEQLALDLGWGCAA